MGITGTDSKVSGRTVMVAIEGVMSVFRGRMRSTLNQQGIEEPDPRPDAWYEMSDFIEVLRHIEEDAGENACRKVGEAGPEFVDWPQEPTSTHDALASLSDAYESEHRNPTGGYEYVQTGSASGRVTTDTPYPCVFDQGFVKGTASSFGASGVRLDHADSCRADGDDVCTFELSW